MKKRALWGVRVKGPAANLRREDGKFSPTLALAVAVAFAGAIIAANLMVKEKVPERWPAGSSGRVLELLGKAAPKAPPPAPPQAEPPKPLAPVDKPASPPPVAEAKPAPVPATPAKPPPPPAPAPPVAKAVPPPAPPPPAPKPAAPVPAPATKPMAYAVGGNFIVNVGMYKNQSNLAGLETKLASLGIPSFRDKIMRKGEGFRLWVTGPDAARAAQILKAEGFESSAGPDRMDAYFYIDKEMNGVKALLSSKGITSATEKFSGDMPIWRLACGPFAEADAQAVQTLIKDKNIADAIISRRAK